MLDKIYDHYKDIYAFVRQSKSFKVQPLKQGVPKHVKVISVCTNPCIELNNWKHSLDNLGYDYSVLGFLKPWKGWKWRTKKYLKEVKKQDDDTLVVLSDATDVLFVQPPEVLVNKFLALNSNVIVGAESACCSGEPAKFMHKFKDYVTKLSKVKGITSRWIYPNGGLVIGWARHVEKLLKENIHEKDDQEGYYKIWYGKNPIFKLDTTQSIVANFPKLNKYVVTDNLVDRELNLYDLQDGLLINKLTGESPVILHFSGKNIDYNTVGKTFFPWFVESQKLIDEN